MSVSSIFMVPNTKENTIKKNIICSIYKEEFSIPQEQGVNIFNVMKWANENYTDVMELVDEVIKINDIN